MSKKLNIGIRAQVDTNTLEIFILGEIYNGWTYDWETGYQEVNWVQNLIDKVKAQAPKIIKMTIDSEGGDLTVGLPFYNFLKTYDAIVESDIIGLAGSTASVIPQASTKGKRRIARNAFMVIHRAWGGGSGNAEDLRAAADVIDMYTDQMVNIYEINNTAGKTAKEIAALMATGDYWMTGEQAVAMGFADELIPENPEFKFAARVNTLDANYKNVPKIMAQVQPASDVEDLQMEKSFMDSIKNAFMDLKKHVSAALGGASGQADSKAKEQPATQPATVSAAATNPAKPLEVDPAAETAPADINAAITPILEAFAAGIETEINAELVTLKAGVMADVAKLYDAKISKLETVNAELAKKNGILMDEVKETGGAETETKNDATANGRVGKWV